MDRARLATITLVLAMTAACGDFALGQPPAESLKVATYNINWGDRDLEQVVATIERADADIVCLQETTSKSEARIRRTLGKRYPQIHFQGHQGRFAAERFGFLSRHPIKRLSFLPPKHGLFGAYVAQVAVGDRNVQVVNVHLQPAILRRGGGVGQAFSALFAMEQTHKKEIAYVFERIEQDVPTLVLGDFNSLSTFQAPTFLKERGLVDSFAQVHEEPDSHFTWHWPLKYGQWSLRIDYIFHSPHFATRKSSVLRSKGSDHYLLTSTLSLLTEKPSQGAEQ